MRSSLESDKYVGPGFRTYRVLHLLMYWVMYPLLYMAAASVGIHYSRMY